MTETVIAVFDDASAADTALQDLEVARIPSADIRRKIGDDPKPLVAVTVDEKHAGAVTGILSQYGARHVEASAMTGSGRLRET